MKWKSQEYQRLKAFRIENRTGRSIDEINRYQQTPRYDTFSPLASHPEENFTSFFSSLYKDAMQYSLNQLDIKIFQLSTLVLLH